MMIIINILSLLAILSSLLVAAFHPRIKLPVHVDILMIFLSIGAAALFINTVINGDLYGHFRNAEIWFRFGFACLTTRFVYQCLRKKELTNEL